MQKKTVVLPPVRITVDDAQELGYFEDRKKRDQAERRSALEARLAAERVAQEEKRAKREAAREAVKARRAAAINADRALEGALADYRRADQQGRDDGIVARVSVEKARARCASHQSMLAAMQERANYLREALMEAEQAVLDQSRKVEAAQAQLKQAEAEADPENLDYRTRSAKLVLVSSIKHAADAWEKVSPAFRKQNKDRQLWKSIKAEGLAEAG